MSRSQIVRWLRELIQRDLELAKQGIEDGIRHQELHGKLCAGLSVTTERGKLEDTPLL